MLKTSCFLLIIFCSCHNFYLARKIDNAPGNHLDSFQHMQRYFILRNGNTSYYMRELKLSDDQKIVNCQLDSLAPEHMLHLHNGRRGKMQYQKSNPDEFPVLSEVHLYIQRDSTIQLGSYTLSLDKVQKIEVIEKDKLRTQESYIIGAVGFTLGAIAVAAVIIAATKSSCPFVSGYDGTQFALQGEIYGGSIYPQLARDDYMPLRLKPNSDNTFQVKISNELQENATEEIAKDKKQWVDFMMKYELGLDKPDPKRATKSALNIGVSYIVGGLVPLSPYFFVDDPVTGLKISAALTLLCLFIFGWFKSKVTGVKPWSGALRVMLIGAVAAGAAFGVAKLFEG